MSMRRLSVIGGSVGAGGTTGSFSASGSSAGCLWRIQAPPPARPARPRKGSAGRPGISASTAAAPAASASGLGLPPSWRISAASAGPSTPPLVTTMPAAVETSSAGICETRPSPTVSVVKVAAASANGMPWRTQADREAAEMLMDGDQQPGDRVAAHEFRGAVHGAVEAALLLELAAATRARSSRRSCRPRDRRRSPSACRASRRG